MGKKIKERRIFGKKLLINIPAESTDNDVIVWRFDKIDKDGDFAFDINRKDFDTKMVFQKILEFSSMSWNELIPSDSRKSRHHILAKSSFSEKALMRIEHLKLEEYTDAFYSFALNSKARLIGIRKGAIFQVVWYDANHEFAPSEKKHT